MSAQLVHSAPKKSNGGPPLLFVHGAFSGAWCWEEHFLPWFAKAGFDAYAIDLPGRIGRPDYENLQGFTVADYLNAVLDAVKQFDTPPVLIGHSMGGYLGWRAAEISSLAGLVLMAPVPPTGMAAPAMQLMVSNPELFMDMSEITQGEAASVETLFATLFSNEVPQETVMRHLKRFQNESRLAVAGLYTTGFPNALAFWGTPVRVMGAGLDPLIPPAHVHWTASLCGRSAHIYQGMGHGMMLDVGWERVAEGIAEWLVEQNLAGND
jgi:pimeloyl-ACP methyl ester carboxylesterase